MHHRHAVRFFDTQFQQQAASGQFQLNPFEQLALPHLDGELLDLGCGLGNLALAAARNGCTVTALDGSPAAIARIRESALTERLAIDAHAVDLAHYRLERDFDSIACIGLLMFLPEATARILLADMAAHVRPGGRLALNVLTEGTTFLGMFEPDHFCLLPRGALKAALPGWTVLAESHDVFPAPGDTVKVFDTLIAQRPTAPPAVPHTTTP